MSKVFGIGMFKTGTTSLGRAFDILGYKTFHGPWNDTTKLFTDNWYEKPEEWLKYHKNIQNLISNYSAFQDYPFMWVFKECDKWYSDAKFVLTVRDPIAVANSDANMWNTPIEELKRNGTYQKFIDRYNNHYEMVQDYFKNKDNLLEIRITAGS